MAPIAILAICVVNARVAHFRPCRIWKGGCLARLRATFHRIAYSSLPVACAPGAASIFTAAPSRSSTQYVDNPLTLYNSSDSRLRMVDRQPVSPESAFFGEQGSHCGQGCSFNGDKKHVVDNTNAIWCSDCAMQLNGDVQLFFHLQGLLHRKGVQRGRRLALSDLYRIEPTNQLAHGSER
jgi:hypothetical protein